MTGNRTNESKLLEDHRKENKNILTLLPCFLYTVISIVYFLASYIDK